MTYLLDTDTCIQYLNGRSTRVRQRMERADPDDIALCSITKAELYWGIRRSREPQRTRSLLDAFVSRFRSLPFEDSCIEAYCAIRFQLENQGSPIGANDLLIAAISMANELTLITHNVGEFSRIRGLAWEDWETGLQSAR